MLRGGHIGLGWTLNPMMGFLLRRERVGDTQRENGHIKMEAEIGVMVPQPRNSRGDQKLEETGKDSSLWRDHGLAGVLILDS